jgi:hypothetical protein
MAGLAVLVAAGATVTWPRAARVKMENYVHIQHGMTLSEVETILDAPPGDYRTVRPVVETEDLDRLFATSRARGSHATTDFWQCDEGLLAVHFNLNGEADTIRHVPSPGRPTASPFDSLLWRVKRQWHRWFPE